MGVNPFQGIRPVLPQFARQEEQKGGPSPLSEQKGGQPASEAKGATTRVQPLAQSIQQGHLRKLAEPSAALTPLLAGRAVGPIQPVPKISSIADPTLRPAIRPPVSSQPRAPVGYEPKK